MHSVSPKQSLVSHTWPVAFGGLCWLQTKPVACQAGATTLTMVVRQPTPQGLLPTKRHLEEATYVSLALGHRTLFCFSNRATGQGGCHRCPRACRVLQGAICHNSQQPQNEVGLWSSVWRLRVFTASHRSSCKIESHGKTPVFQAPSELFGLQRLHMLKISLPLPLFLGGGGNAASSQVAIWSPCVRDLPLA